MGNSDSISETLYNCCQCDKEESAPVGAPTYIPTYPTYHTDGQFGAAPEKAKEPIELLVPPISDKLAEIPNYEEFGLPPPAPFPGLPQGLPPGPPDAFSMPEQEIRLQETSSKVQEEMKAPEASPESTRASSEEAQTERTNKTNNTQTGPSKDTIQTGTSKDSSPRRSHSGRLPPGWQECISKSSGKTYYYNRASGESTFVAPKFDDSADYATLPAGWVEMTSKSTGKVYYWNAALQKSQFERPLESAQ